MAFLAVIVLSGKIECYRKKLIRNLDLHRGNINFKAYGINVQILQKVCVAKF